MLWLGLFSRSWHANTDSGKAKSYYVHIWRHRKYWMLTESDQNDTGIWYHKFPNSHSPSDMHYAKLLQWSPFDQPIKKMEVGVQWEGFFGLESIWEQLSRDVFIHTDTVNIIVFRTVQLLWKVKWISVDIPYRKTSKTWRQQVYVHVAIHRETMLRQ